ncbi:hypothetical protein BSL78_21532 [Apostichopus japonicus]|uniref:Glycosyltransferase 61 catalytic domain-containing protein n=1 Tax=Stichopus japonicus TaxID=307972 RepID=A0A2G8K0T9_STIJA|nr:hypothetical protein BSL78_21532 [Apostichopus japonicus]
MPSKAHWKFAVKVFFLSIGFNVIISFEPWYVGLLFKGSVRQKTDDRLSVSGTEYPEGELLWCTLSDRSWGRVCKFRNLCYMHINGEFALFHGNTAKTGHEQDAQLLGNRLIKDIVSLTSALGAEFPFNLAHISIDNIVPGKLKYFNYRSGSYHLFRAFNVGNTAHAIHDDLLPVFYTLSRYDNLTEEPTSTLIYWRELSLNKLMGFYQLFSQGEPISQNDLTFEPEESLTCFQDIIVGLSTETLWYQWGLPGFEPEGALKGSNATSSHIAKFTGYVRKRMGLPLRCPIANDYGIIFIRKKTRLILNEEKLSEVLSKTLQLEMRELSLEKNTFKEIIKTVSCAKVLVGMHGAMMIFPIFLPPSSFVLELHPYAINPRNFTPYKTAVELSGMDIEYRAWRNMNRSNTVTHPTEALHRGGISHLSKEEQERITNLTEIRPHQCCQHPEVQFRLYQDTLIDIPSVVNILTNTQFYKNRNGKFST